MAYLNDVIVILGEVADSAAAEYTYKALEVAVPLLPRPYGEAIEGLVHVARTMAANDAKRQVKIAEILAKAEADAQVIADSW